MHASEIPTQEFIELWNATSKWANNWVGFQTMRDREDIYIDRYGPQVSRAYQIAYIFYFTWTEIKYD